MTTVKILPDKRELARASPRAGDVYLYPDPGTGPELPWVVAAASETRGFAALGRFARRSHAFCFAGFVAGESPPAAVEPGQAAGAISTRSLETPEPPQVLVVVEYGTARVVSRGEVQIACVNLDSQRHHDPGELAPVPIEFEPLLAQAGVRWPTARPGSDGAR